MLPAPWNPALRAKAEAADLTEAAAADTDAIKPGTRSRKKKSLVRDFFLRKNPGAAAYDPEPIR